MNNTPRRSQFFFQEVVVVRSTRFDKIPSCNSESNAKKLAHSQSEAILACRPAVFQWNKTKTTSRRIDAEGSYARSRSSSCSIVVVITSPSKRRLLIEVFLTHFCVVLFLMVPQSTALENVHSALGLSFTTEVIALTLTSYRI